MLKHSSSPKAKDKIENEFDIPKVARKSQQVSKYQKPEPKKNAPYTRLKTADSNIAARKSNKVEIIKAENKRK